jgi:putative membrane protein
MNVGRSYSFLQFLAWTRRRAFVLLAVSLVPVVVYETLGLKWVALPWAVAALLGTAASFIVGFKNVQTYQRTIEAQQVWTSIASLSRYWALLCRDLPKGPTLLRPMIHRHLAWLTALRYQVRQRRVWERQSARSNEEYQRKRFRVAEWDVPLETELQKFLAAQEMAEIAAVGNQAGWLLGVQSAALRELYVNQDLAVLHHTEMQRTLKDMLDQQGRAERIKNFPYPRQYAAVNTIFIWSFALCLPLCLVREFDRLNDLATGFLAGHLAWLTVPFSTLIAWLYFSLDQVGESTENPFEGNANDVPITQLCRTVEIELRGLLGESDLPPSLSPQNQIIL